MDMLVKVKDGRKRHHLSIRHHMFPFCSENFKMRKFRKEACTEIAPAAKSKAAFG